MRARIWWLSLIALASPVFFGGCVVQDELDDDIREVIPTMKFASLSARPNGAGQLDFTFHYALGIRDPEGVDQIDWRYRLMTREQAVLAAHAQQMRKADLDKVEVLVEGDRTRKLTVSGGLRDGETYILWVTMYYRDEIFEELLTRLVANGPPVMDDVDFSDLPSLP